MRSLKTEATSQKVEEDGLALLKYKAFDPAGIELHVALLFVALDQVEFSVDPRAEVRPELEDGTSIARARLHAHVSYSAVQTGGGRGSGVVIATSAPLPPGGSGNPPNRITVGFDADMADTSEPLTDPWIRFRDEELACGDGALFVVLVDETGPKRPTRIATELDLASAPSDPTEFVQSLTDEQPELRELIEGTR